MLKKAYHILFFLGIFFFPFNEYEGIPFLGEFKSEAGALFLFAGVLILFFHVRNEKRISIPLNHFVYQLLIIFFLWCVVCSLLNFNGMLESFFKHTSGINRFVRQIISLFISMFLFFQLYWVVLKEMSLDEILIKIRKTFLYSLIVASVYGFLELLVSMFGVSMAYQIVKLFDYFPFLEVVIHREGRISSISYEPPFFAIYLVTISGWMFSYILTETSSKKYIPTLLVLALTFFSGSRTGLMVVSIQLIIFCFYMYKESRLNINFKKIVLITFFFSAGLIFLNGTNVIKAVGEKIESLDFIGNLKTNVSNKSRFGMQYAQLQVFKKHPVVGVGFGQQTYYSRLEYPYWAVSNNYEFVDWYKNKNDKPFPPGYNIYTRIMAETGIIGIILFLFPIFISISMTKKLIRKTNNNQKVLAIVIHTTLIGLYINWLQIDSFRMYGVWLSLAILMRFSYTFQNENE